MKNSNIIQRGFTLIEILVVIAVISIVSTIGFQAFFNANKHQALEKDAEIVKSFLGRARSMTLSSFEKQQYGIHVNQTQVVIFRGSTYDPATSTNLVQKLSPHTVISDVSLSGGGTDIVFQRLSGKTVNFGTITISLTADPTKIKTVKINGTGLVE